MPWRVEGTAEAGVRWGMLGAAVLARAGMCPPAEGAGGGRMGRAGSPIAWGHCGSCFTCGSRVAAIPPRAAMRSLASVSALWRATTVCHSAPHMRKWVPPAAMARPQTLHACVTRSRYNKSSSTQEPNVGIACVWHCQSPPLLCMCDTPNVYPLRQVCAKCRSKTAGRCYFGVLDIYHGTTIIR